MLKKISFFLFSNQTTRQTITKNAFWLSISQFGGRLLRSLIIIYAARVLGAAAWGVFSYALTISAILTFFVDGGINSIVNRDAGRLTNDQRNALLSTALIIKLILIAIGCLLIIFVAPYLITLEGVTAILIPIAFIMAFETLREFGFALVRALEKMEWEAGLILLTNLTTVIIGFIVLKTTPTLNSFTLAYVIGTGIGLVATAITLRHYFQNITNHASFKLVKPILFAAWPLAVTGILGMLLTNTDILIIGFFRSAEDVGYYSAAIRLIQLLYVLPTIFGLSVLPTLSRLAGESKERFRTIFEQITTLLFLIAIPVGIGGIITANSLIPFIFGNSYVFAIMPFQILLATLIFDYPGLILSYGIFAFNQQKKLIWYSVIGGIGNVIFDLLLIPPFGIVGSAIATLCAQMIATAYLWSAMNAIQPFRILPHLRKIIIATIIMILGTFAFQFLAIPIIINIILSALLYATALFIFREPLVKEFRSLIQNKTEKVGS